MGIPPAAPAHNASLVNRASSLNTFAGHGPLAHTVFWWAGPGLRVVSRASSPYTLAGQTPPVVTILRRHLSSESLFSPPTRDLPSEWHWQADNRFLDLLGEEVGSSITAELKDVSRPPLVDTLPSITRTR